MATRRRSRRKTISGNLTDIQKRVRYLETRPAPSKLANKVVATKNIAIESIVDDLVATQSLTRRTIANSAIGTDQIEPDSITNNLIATDAVTTDSIAPSAVTTTEIATDAVTTDKIATDAITNNELATNSVNADSIAPGSVGENELAFGSVTTDKIGGLQVTDEKIAGIQGSKIIGGVDGDLIINNSIEAIKIAGVNSTVLIGQIQDAQIEELDGSKIIARSLPAVAIESESITEDELAQDSVGFDELQFNSVAYAQIQEDAVQELSIASLSIARRHMQDNVIIARMINAGAVETAKIQNLAVTSGKIADGAIVNGKIQDSTITTNKIFGGTNIATSVNSTGTGISVSSVGNANGRGYTVALSVGSGSTQLALGSHVHGQNGYSAAGSSGVPSHTHPISFSTTVTGGVHAGHSIPNNGNHSHTVSASGNSGTPSTIKLKKEVTDYSIVDVKNLLNLNLKRYKYKNQVRHLQEGREWMYGYIAEEVQELGIEEIIGYDENKEPNAINYGLLSTLVLELVKVQQTEIDSLKEEIQRLKEKI